MNHKIKIKNKLFKILIVINLLLTCSAFTLNDFIQNLNESDLLIGQNASNNVEINDNYSVIQIIKNNQTELKLKNESEKNSINTIFKSTTTESVTDLNHPAQHVKNSYESMSTTTEGEKLPEIVELSDGQQKSLAGSEIYEKSTASSIDLQENTSTKSDYITSHIPASVTVKRDVSDTNSTNNFSHTSTETSTAVTEKPTSVTQNQTTTESHTHRDDDEDDTLLQLDVLSSVSAETDDNNIGQTIKIERSQPKSEYENEVNTPGEVILKNLSDTCGTFLGKRVSFGHPTTLMAYPWTALLLYNTSDKYHCGGSLITSRYVLTAAHCVAHDFYPLYAVRLGEHDLTTEEDCAEDVGTDFICADKIEVNVIKIIIHHGYSKRTQKNDIALLKLKDEVTFTRSHHTICLPPPNEDYHSHSQATIAGWGATEKSYRSNVLLEAEVPLHDMSSCSNIYRYNKFNDTTELCGSGSNEVDVCKGDSGGAIFYRQQGKRSKIKYVQLGIISLGVRRCGDSRFLPAVFTKLSSYFKWIENNLEY